MVTVKDRFGVVLHPSDHFVVHGDSTPLYQLHDVGLELAESNDLDMNAPDGTDEVLIRVSPVSTSSAEWEFHDSVDDSAGDHVMVWDDCTVVRRIPDSERVHGWSTGDVVWCRNGAFMGVTGMPGVWAGTVTVTGVWVAVGSEDPGATEEVMALSWNAREDDTTYLGQYPLPVLMPGEVVRVPSTTVRPVGFTDDGILDCPAGSVVAFACGEVDSELQPVIGVVKPGRFHGVGRNSGLIWTSAKVLWAGDGGLALDGAEVSDSYLVKWPGVLELGDVDLWNGAG